MACYRGTITYLHREVNAGSIEFSDQNTRLVMIEQTLYQQSNLTIEPYCFYYSLILRFLKYNIALFLVDPHWVHLNIHFFPDPDFISSFAFSSASSMASLSRRYCGFMTVWYVEQTVKK